MTKLSSYTGSDDNTKTSKKSNESRSRAFLGTKKYIYWIELQSCNELHIYIVWIACTAIIVLTSHLHVFIDIVT